jgi:hypothetical protein
MIVNINNRYLINTEQIQMICKSDKYTTSSDLMVWLLGNQDTYIIPFSSEKDRDNNFAYLKGVMAAL